MHLRLTRLGALPLLATLLALPLAAQAPETRIEVPFRQFMLPNGLNVILHQDRTVPTVTVNVWYHVGSANERPGRTGFAHLFEHLMFEGSKNVPEGQLDIVTEASGGTINGSTTNDRTNYYIDVPSNALELALFLESDRMGYLLDTMTPELVDGQRAIVMNERRQSYDNQPYGLSWLELDAMLWPDGHPYHWPVIGSMEDLAAASYEDVVAFFERYYAPNNASLVVAGDIDLDETRALVEKWFGEIPGGEPVVKTSAPLPRLLLGWVTPPAYAPGTAALDIASSVLAGGKNSRLYRRLVYDTQMAQDVFAYQDAMKLGGAFVIVATARPGVAIGDIERAIDEEIDRLRREPPTAREMERVHNKIEASFYRQMERTGGFYGKADRLNAYYFQGASPDFFAEDLARSAAVDAADVRATVNRWLPAGRRVELVVEPEPVQ